MGSRADKQLSIRTLPAASEELPELAELRSNRTRPECAKSSMDDMNSERAMPYTGKKLPEHMCVRNGIGNSGCRKSTAKDMLSGLTTPYRGSSKSQRARLCRGGMLSE